MADWWESAPIVGGSSANDRIRQAFEEGVTRAELGASERSEELPFDYTGFSPVVPGLTQEERDKAIFEGTAQGAREAGPVAASLATIPLGVGVGARLLPFLLRMGAGRRAAGAVAGGAASLPAAVPQLVRGDIGGAAKSVAAGAVTGGIAPGLFGAGRAAGAAVPAAEAALPATTRVATPIGAAGREVFEAQSAELAKMLGQTPSAAAPPAWNTISSQATQLANKLRQVAETSATNKKLVMDAIKSDFEAAGFPTWQAFRDFVFQARTRMP